MENITPIYRGSHKDFVWVGFGSGSGTNLRECAKAIKPGLIFSNRPNAKLFKLEELANVEHAKLDSWEYCGSWKKAQGDTQAEAEYKRKSNEFDCRIVEILKSYEQKIGKQIDLIVLGGYMKLVGSVIVREYPDKIINVHPSRIPLDKNHKRTLLGDDAVYDAIKAGARRTCSSVIIVDEQTDHGEKLTEGAEVIVWDEVCRMTDEEIKEYAPVHQGLQKRRSDWPALRRALTLIAQGRLALGTEKQFYNEWRRVYLDWEPLDYDGCKVNEKMEIIRRE